MLRTVKRRKTNWIGHIWHRNCLLMHVIDGKIEGRIEGTVRRRRRKKLLDDPKEKREYRKLRGSIKSHSVENSLWRRLWTFREIDCVMNEYSSRLGHSCLAAEFTPFLVCPQGVYLISVP